VTRHAWVTVRYQDTTGVWHELRAAGDLAELLQHEIDHLDGILFTTKVIEGTLRRWDPADEAQAEALEGELVG